MKYFVQFDDDTYCDTVVSYTSHGGWPSCSCSFKGTLLMSLVTWHILTFEWLCRRDSRCVVSNMILDSVPRFKYDDTPEVAPGQAAL
jgi:hypothetical protein